jgi:hypothetical protein
MIVSADSASFCQIDERCNTLIKFRQIALQPKCSNGFGQL